MTAVVIVAEAYDLRHPRSGRPHVSCTRKAREADNNAAASPRGVHLRPVPRDKQRPASRHGRKRPQEKFRFYRGRQKRMPDARAASTVPTALRRRTLATMRQPQRLQQQHPRRQEV